MTNKEKQKQKNNKVLETERCWQCESCEREWSFMMCETLVPEYCSCEEGE